jgi:histone deacetylase 6
MCPSKTSLVGHTETGAGLSPREHEGSGHVSTFCLLDPDHYKFRDMAGVTPPARVGYCYDPRMREHKHLSYDHPEQPARITSIFETLENSGCTSRMIVLPAREVSEDEVTLVHNRDVWDQVNEIECKISSAFHFLGAYFVILRSAFRPYVRHSPLALSPSFVAMTMTQIRNKSRSCAAESLFINHKTPSSVRLSCGATIEAAMAVATGRCKRSVAIVRPPGHHAEPNKSMGFCFFNNVAVAAKVILQKTAIRKILILDWWVNGINTSRKRSAV